MIPRRSEGVGINYTTLTTGFTQPVVNSAFTATVKSTGWMSAGAVIYIQGGGYYSVSSVLTSTTVSLTNIGLFGNLAPGLGTSAGAKITAAGPLGYMQSPAGRFNIAELAAGLASAGTAQGLGTATANLCTGPKFYVCSTTIQCYGADFYWRNNGSTSHNIIARLWDLTGATLLASSSQAITADGRYQLTWAGVTLTINREYWVNVGPTDSSSENTYLQASFTPTGISAATGTGGTIGAVNFAGFGDYNTAGTSTTTGNTGFIATVWPMLAG